MAGAKLPEINKMMDDFLEKADRVSFKKQDLTDNLGQLKEAIKMFERLLELRDAVGDPDSPRAVQYYKLAQQIASINEGWRNAQSQLSREATLADRDPGHPDRLSEDERNKLKSLMLSSKLKNFVEYLDVDNPENFALLKSMVQSQEMTVNRQAPTLDDVKSPTPPFDPAKFKEDVHKSMEVIMKEYADAREVKARLRDNDLRIYISGLFFNYFNALYKTLGLDKEEVSKDKSEDNKDLIEQEEERQQTVVEEQAYAEVVETSKEVSAYIAESRPTNPKQTRGKLSEESKKKPKGSSWWDDIQEVLKWGMLLAGGMAAVAGVASVLSKSFESFKERGAQAKADLEKALKDYMDRKAEGLEASISRLDKDGVSDAAADMKARIEALQSNPNMAGMAPKLDAETITLMGAIRATGNTKMMDHFIKVFAGDNTKGEVAVMRALLEGKDTAEWRDHGRTFSVPLSPRVNVDDLSEEQLAQRYVNTVDEARKNVIQASTYRGLRGMLTPEESDAWYEAQAAKGRELPTAFERFMYQGNLIDDRFSQVLNYAYRDLVAGRQMKLPDNWDSMSPSEQEKYLLSSNRFVREMDRKLSQRASLLWDPANVEGIPAESLSDLQVGEIITHPNATRSRKQFPGLAEAIKSGNVESVIGALNRTSFAGKSWSMQNPEDVYRAKVIMNTKDWGGSEEAYFKSVNEGMQYFGRQPVQPPVQQTIINNYTQENSQDTKPGSN